MIDRDLKRSLGQMMKGVQVVGAAADGILRAYCSHWVCQVSFEEPIVLASVSPKHDTHPLIVTSGRFSVSILAADQIAEGQYFSYPGRRFQRALDEYVEVVDGLPVVPDAIAWLTCEVFDRVERLPGGVAGRPGVDLDHDLFFARVTGAREGRLGEPPLLYSSRLGWRGAGERVRGDQGSVRDELLARVAERVGDGDEGAEPSDG